MAPHDPEATPRLYVNYTVGGEDHTQMFRYPPSGSQSAAVDTIVEMWAFLDGGLYLCTIDSLEYSIEGSSVHLPLAWPGDPTYGTGTPTAGQEMKFISVVGKDSFGTRTRLEQFGIIQVIPATWRLPVGVNSILDDWFAHYQAAHTAGVFCTIGEDSAFFNQYYNFKYADNDIAKVRG